MVSYDDEESICYKTAYVLDNNLHGFIIWELSGDLMPDLTTPLLDAINYKLAHPDQVCG
jgi:chitinase